MKISVVIPCYNSQSTIAIAVSEIVSAINKRNTNDDYEIILVNDSSKDGTWSEIKKLCLENKKIIGVDLAKNFGQANALMAGFSIATGEYVMTAEDDCQSSPEYMWEMIDLLGDDYDIVCARNITNPKRGFVRGIGTRINKYALNNLLSKPKGVSPSIFFVAKKVVIKTMLQYENSYPYLPGLILRSTSKIGNYDINRRERISGHSGYNLKKLVNLLIDGVTTFSIKPLHFIFNVALVFSLVSIIDLMVLVISLIVGKEVSSIAWLFFIVFLISSIIFYSLSIMADYIGRIYMVANKNPQFIIRSVINHKED